MNNMRISSANCSGNFSKRHHWIRLLKSGRGRCCGKRQFNEAGGMMTNDEAPMTKECPSTKHEARRMALIVWFVVLLSATCPLLASDPTFVEGITEPFLDVTLSASVPG